MPVNAFLSADWQNIVILSWPVDARLLLPYLPPGLEIDRFDGAAYISAVGLTVANSRVAGIPVWPRRYQQVNFRFYARRTTAGGGCRPGVVFLRQLVPNRIAALSARLLYHEPFQYAPMSNALMPSNTPIPDAPIPGDGGDAASRAPGSQCRIAYRWRRNGQTAGFWAESAAPAEYAAPGSLSEFLTARYWGYNYWGYNYWGYTGAGGALREYPVRREPWRLQPAADCGFTNLAAIPILDGSRAIAAALAGPPASALIAQDGGPAHIGWPRRCG